MWSSYSPSLPYPPSSYGPRALHLKCVYASGGWQPLSTNIFINHTFFFNLLRQSAFPFLLELLFPAPGVLFVESRNWGREWDVLLYRVIAIRKRRNIQNAVFCEVNFGKESRLICLCHIKRCRSFSGQDGTVQGWFCLKACQISKVHARSYQRTNNCRKQSPQDEASNMQLDRGYSTRPRTWIVNI